MTLQNNMDRLLRWLYEKDKEDSEIWLQGPEIQDNLQLRIPEINDALDLLYDNGLIDRMSWMGTAPYNFGQIRINPQGKYEVESVNSKKDLPVFDARKKLLFFSYSTKDRVKVGEICDILTGDYNFDVFKAHDTIRVTQEWRTEIKENLDNCDGLVAYITRNFRSSEWTYQECGWVAGRGIPIYSLFIMKKIPSGFIEERQGTRILDSTEPKEIAQQINGAFG